LLTARNQCEVFLPELVVLRSRNGEERYKRIYELGGSRFLHCRTNDVILCGQIDEFSGCNKADMEELSKRNEELLEELRRLRGEHIFLKDMITCLEVFRSPTAVRNSGPEYGTSHSNLRPVEPPANDTLFPPSGLAPRRLDSPTPTTSAACSPSVALLEQCRYLYCLLESQAITYLQDIIELFFRGSKSECRQQYASSTLILTGRSDGLVVRVPQLKVDGNPLTQHLLEWNSSLKIVSTEQYGILSGSSTCTQLIDCTNDWIQALESVLPQLQREIVRVLDFLSGVKCSFSGVPQGAILSPILFLLFTSDLLPHRCLNSLVAEVSWGPPVGSSVRASAGGVASDVGCGVGWCSIWDGGVVGGWLAG
uniref:Reverse transcriptase domain-containing protein n=1 Tax=Heligmosomoides polygyrus TaxID=6339 RepID=A0A8L8KUX4_HELPZ